jgi:hypothetical protein
LLDKKVFKEKITSHYNIRQRTMSNPTVREYAPRPNNVKEDSTNPFTLIARMYKKHSTNYYRNHAEKIKEKHRERYKNNPEYRASCLVRAKASALRKKERLALLKERAIQGL